MGASGMRHAPMLGRCSRQGRRALAHSIENRLFLGRRRSGDATPTSCARVTRYACRERHWSLDWKSGMHSCNPTAIFRPHNWLITSMRNSGNRKTALARTAGRWEKLAFERDASPEPGRGPQRSSPSFSHEPGRPRRRACKQKDRQRTVGLGNLVEKRRIELPTSALRTRRSPS